MASAAATKKRNRYPGAHATYGNVAYDLNYASTVARPLHGGEETAQPRPLVRPREGAAARPKVRVREAGQISLFAVVGFLAVGVFAVLVLMSSIQMITVSDDIAELKSQLTVLQKEEAKLRTQFELAFDQASIETKMTADGTMMRPQSGQIFYLDLSEPDSVEVFEDSGVPLAGAAGALGSIGDVFGSVVEYFR